MNDKTKIQVQDLVKIFGPHPRRRPLEMLRAGASKDEILQETGHVVGVNNVSFDVQQGEVFVVMGLSGSGKSTLIRCLNRLFEPTAGSVVIDGEDVLAANKKRLQEIRRTRMAMVFQHFGLFPHKTVGYNAAYGLRVRGVSEAEQEEKALEALELVGLGDWADHYPSNLSGGMQQRVGLARALATDADILLMDEAFSALDPLIRRQMQDELMQLQDRLHKTIVFITHDLNEALRIGNHVAVMRDGAIVQIGAPEEIITEPADAYVARFMADVDQSRVLSAEFVMKPALQVTQTANLDEALSKMAQANADMIFVVDRTGEVEGVVRRKELTAHQRNGAHHKPLREFVRIEFPTATRLTPINELYGLAQEGTPVAVVGGDGKLVGAVYPLDILAALAVTEEVAVEDVLREEDSLVSAGTLEAPAVHEAAREAVAE